MLIRFIERERSTDIARLGVLVDWGRRSNWSSPCQLARRQLPISVVRYRPDTLTLYLLNQRLRLVDPELDRAHQRNLDH